MTGAWCCCAITGTFVGLRWPSVPSANLRRAAAVRLRTMRQQHLAMGRRLHRGFTLIEMMIVLAVLAILAAIALPAYQEQVRKGRRASAQAHLVDGATQQPQ